MTQSDAAAPRIRLTPRQRRESILTAATEVFAEHGYRRGKVSAIATLIGVSEPVVFQNFGTKAALFRAVLDRAATTACEVLTAVIEHGGSVSDLLEVALSPAHVEQLHSSGALGVLFSEAAGLTADPDVGDAARQTIQRVATALADVLAHGQQAGDVRAELDPVAASWWVLSLLSARTFRTAIAPDPVAVESQLAAMTLRVLSASADGEDRRV